MIINPRIFHVFLRLLPALIIFAGTGLFAQFERQTYGKISRKVLKVKTVLRHTTFPAGTIVKMDDKGLVAEVVLAKDQAIADVRFKGNFPFIFKAGSRLDYRSMFKNQMPEMPEKITITKPTTLFGITFPAYSKITPGASFMRKKKGPKRFRFLYFQVRISKGMTIRGKKLESGTYLQLAAKKLKYLHKGKMIDVK